MSEIRVIETVYNGYRFRSRLEARWAVFLDTLGIQYEYEKEGYHLPSGMFLPDFWLFGLRAWLEVKPDGVCQHAGHLRDATDAPVLVTHGLPDNEMILHCYDIGESGGGASEWPCLWAQNYMTREIVIAVEPYGHALYRNSTMNQHCDFTLDINLCGVGRKLSDAHQAAKQARFEHGETPSR